MNNTETISSNEFADEHNNAIPNTVKQTLFQRLEKIVSLSQIIRAFGACAIIASMSLFMLQGWADGNDITRYLKLLAQTGLLTGAGLALSFLIKEFKGARVFFGLALVSVVANFTILGSLTYSLFPMDMQIVNYPESMKWEVSTAALFLPVFFGALALLSAVTYFGFSIFSRQIAKPLTLSLLGLSATLLIPVRAPLVAIVLSGIALWGAWFLIKRVLIPRLAKAGTSTQTLVMTKETKVSLAMLLLPGLIILTRAVSFYNIDDLTILAFCGVGYYALRCAVSLIEGRRWFKRLAEAMQLTLSAYIAVLVTQVLPIAWNSVDIFLGASVFLAFAFEKLMSNSDEYWKTIIVNATTIAVIPIVVLNATTDYELIYSLQALLVCGLAFGLNLKASTLLSKTLLSRIVSLLGVIASSLIMLFDVIQLVQLGNWVVIGLIGAVLIIGASLYERFGLKLLNK